jgi:hypothetical protein
MTDDGERFLELLRSLTDEQRAALATFMAGLVEKNEKVVPLDPE